MRNLIPAFDIIKEFEGCRLEAYQDPVGIWTIGYGHIAGVYPGQTITQEQAESLLLGEVNEFAGHVEELVRVPISNNQFCALVSFSYNVGIGALGGSTLLRDINNNYPPEVAANEFAKWVYGGRQILPGLVRRRKAEREMFLTADPSEAA